MKSKSLALLLFAAAFSLQGWSQDDDTRNEEFTIYGDRELFVQDANKINSLPRIKELVDEMPSLTYTTIPNKVNAVSPIAPIPAAKIQVEEKLSKLYHGYVNAGIGLYFTPQLDLYYMDERSRKGSYSVGYHHLSSSGGVAADDSIPDGFSHNALALWGKLFLKKQTLQGNLDWQRDVYNYYGYNPEVTPIAVQDSIKQRFNYIGGNAELKSFFRDSAKVNHISTFGFYNYGDKYEGNETHFDLSTSLNKWWDGLLVEGAASLHVNLYNFFDTQNLIKKNSNNTVFTLKPAIHKVGDQFKATVGVDVALDFGSSDVFHFYPKAYVHYSLLNDLFVPYASVTGSLKQNTYRNLTTDNPWFGPGTEFENTNEKLALRGGIRGTISRNTSFNAYVARTSYEDYLFFANDSLVWGPNHFSAIYDDMNVNTIGGEININFDEEFQLFVKGEVMAYNPDAESEAWNLPNTAFTVRGQYNLKNKLITSVEVYTVGKRPSLSLSPLADTEADTDGRYTGELKGFFDLNLKAEYRYNKRLSVWAKIDNLFAAKYQRYQHFDTQRFVGMMGGTFSF